MEEDTELFDIDDEDMEDCFELSLVGQADTVRPVGGAALREDDPLASPAKQSPLLGKICGVVPIAVKEEPPPSPRVPERREFGREGPRTPLQQLTPLPSITPLRQRAPQRELLVPQLLRPPPVDNAEAAGAGADTAVAGAGAGALRVFQAAPPPVPRSASLAKAREEERVRRAGAKRRSSGNTEGEPPARRRAAELEYELSSGSADDAVSQKEEFMRDFHTGPWLAMLHSADLPPFDLDPSFRLNSCIHGLKSQGTSSRPRALVVLVKHVGNGEDSHPVLIKDPTGAMRGQLHPTVVKENDGKIGEGCVLVLANPPMLYINAFTQILSITSKNIVRIFSAKERIPAAYAGLSAEQRRFDPCLAYRRSAAQGTAASPHHPRTPRTKTPRKRRTDALGGSPYARDSQLTPTAPLQPRQEMDEMDALLASIPDEELTPRG